jgi:hypothetical protein
VWLYERILLHAEYDGVPDGENDVWRFYSADYLHRETLKNNGLFSLATGGAK